MGSNYRESRRYFIDLQKLNPVKTNSLQQKSSKKFTPFFTLLNFNEIGCKQCNENDHKHTIFVLLSNTVHEFREKLFPRVKSEIQIRDFFPAKPEKSKIREIKFQRKISRHSANCARVCFSCNLSAFVSRFQQSRIQELRKFFPAMKVRITQSQHRFSLK